MPEIAPTAGLPPHCGDLWPRRGVGLAQRAAQFIGIDAVQLTCSGTAALVIALTTLYRRTGRRTVVVPAYTCPLVALAVAHCGLRLRLCDLAPDSIDMDAQALARLCNHDTLAVVVTHLGGRVADVGAAIAVARAVGAHVIEDAAQALGARSDGRSVGLAGDAGFFSLAVGKGLTTFEGGILVTRNEDLRAEFARVAAELAPFQLAWELKRCLQLLGYHLAYRPTLLGLAYGMPLRRALRAGDLVAAVGDDFSSAIPMHALGAWRQSVAANAFARLPGFLADCAAQAQRGRQRLAQIDGVEVLHDAVGAQGTWPFLMLRLPSEARRDAILRELWSAGLGVSRLFIHALPDYAYLRKLVGEHEVPNARAFAACTLTVSNSPWLDEVSLEKILEVFERHAVKRR